MRISEFSVRHPVVLGIILITLAFFGIIALIGTNVEFMGAINTPQVYVVAVYPGASSQDIENTVIDVLEDDFVTLQNFKSMTSQATNSLAMIVISFADGVDAYEMQTEVRNRINDLSSSLPSGLQGDPVAIVGGAEMLPIISFAVTGGEDLANLSEYVSEQIVPQITRLEGVSTVTVTGALEPVVEIKARLDDLDSKNISLLNIYQVLSYSNLSMPLGAAEYYGQQIQLRFDASYDSLEDIRNLAVGATEDGKVIHLSDVCDVNLIYEEPEYITRSNGANAIVVEVCKRSDGNTLTITDDIKEILDEERAKSGEVLSFSLISDDSQTIRSSLKNVIESGVLGVIIAVLVIFLFLNDAKATLVIGLSIPLSIFFTTIVMAVMGISINLMSISGIVVSLGSIVDASIVVLDQVYRFYQKKKSDGSYENTLTQAILKGSAVVDTSVIGSNLTTVVVFIPIAMLSGIVGMILYPVSMTFMVAIFSSLIVAIIFVPFLLKLFVREKNRTQAKDNIIGRTTVKLEKVFKRALRYAIDHALLFIVFAFALLLISIYLITALGFAFIPSTDNGDFYIDLAFPDSFTLEMTDDAMVKAYEILSKNVPEMQAYLMYSGKGSSIFDFSTSGSANKGSIHVVLTPSEERERDIHEIISQMQSLLSENIAGAKVSVRNGGFDNLVSFISSGGGYGLTLVGEDQSLLYQEAKRIENFLKSDPEVMSVSINSNYDSRVATMNASYDYMTSMGLTSYEAGMTNAILFNGVDVGVFSSGEDNYDIKLTSDVKDEGIDKSSLSGIKIYSSQTGAKIGLDAIASLDTSTELSQINHVDRSRSITISANLISENTSGVTSRVDDYLKQNPLEEGIERRTGGIGELMNDSYGPLLKMGAIGIFLVYVVMVLVFERYRQPLLIMLTVPFGMIGILLTLVAFGSTLNLISIMGIVTLVGMLVNNGIILVDYTNQLMEAGRLSYIEKNNIEYDKDESIYGIIPMEEEKRLLVENLVEGASSRIRPILMSALTTILGVIPMAFASGSGSEIYAPLGQVIMGGLTASTFITLFLMPLFYYRSEIKRMRRFYSRKERRINK